MRHEASIKHDGEVVIADIDVDIYVGAREWSGSFEAAHNEIGFDDCEYEIELADGRSGRIMIVGQKATRESDTKFVRFQGTGPLQ